MRGVILHLRRFGTSAHSAFRCIQTRPKIQDNSIYSQCWRKQQSRYAHQPVDDPNWVSLVDNPARLVKTGRNHGPGLILLALIPITAFGLGCWQVQRLDWKTKLIAKYEDRLVRPPLPLPPVIDPEAVPEFEFRRIYSTGHFRHDQEMLIGPRMFEGKDGFLVVTPFERKDGSTVLVNRGWIPRDRANKATREQGLPQGEVTVEGLLRSPWKKNMFTPDNKPKERHFYFPDVAEMAALTGSQPIWIEATCILELGKIWDMEAKGIPIGRPPAVNLSNNHAQYIVTWYGLCVATSVMLWMVIRKKPSEINRRVRMNKNW